MQPLEEVSARIVVLRSRKLILDADLAELYGVQTRVLLQAVRRNAGRYPSDFLIVLANQEVAALRSQSVISKRTGRGGRRYAPFAFTEHGAIMAATVNAKGEIVKRLDQLERKVGTHDRAILEILQALRQLTQPPEVPKRRRIGFVHD